VRLVARLREDLGTVRLRDPAARGQLETALVYSGLHAVWAHRVTSRLWRREGVARLLGARFVARVLSQLARTATGVEIHPGAVIGHRVFIDHGMGTVVGETAVVGDDCTLFHGVTLGGKGGRGVAGRRHPTLERGVTVGAGAAVLGGVVVGADSVVGAGAVVTHDVPPGSVAVGVPAVARPHTRTTSPDSSTAGVRRAAGPRGRRRPAR
jgi:serine O-acetyltransferase